MTAKAGIQGIGSAPVLIGPTIGKWVNSDPSSSLVLPAGYTKVWRWVETPDGMDGQFNNPDPEGCAQEWVNKQQPHFKFVSKDTFVSGPNETHPTNSAQGAWFSRFEIRRMQIMEGLGYHCTVGSFGTGHPPLGQDDGWATWTALLPMMRYAKAHANLADFHEYGEKLGQQIDGSWFDGWNLMRWRRVYSWLPLDAQPDFIIGEWGIESPYGTFRDKTWRDRHIDPDAIYMDMARAYDLELQLHPRARGLLIFAGPAPGWDRFEIVGTPFVQLLEAWMAKDTETYPQIAGGWWGKVHVPPHGTPAPVRKTPDNGGEVLWTMFESSAWWYVSDVHWDGAKWWYRVDANETGFGPAGWVKNKSEPDNLDKFGNLPEVQPEPVPTPDPEPTPTPTPTPAPSVDDVFLGFEAGHTDVNASVQKPNGWDMLFKRNGELGFFAVKSMKGSQMAAVCLRDPEVRVIPSQFLPTGERLNAGPHALILDGDNVLKVQGGAYSIRLTRHIEASVNSIITAEIPVLVETNDTPTAGKLEDDHWIVGVRLYTAIQRRDYLSMRGRKEVAGLERDWNVFHFTVPVLTSSGADLEITVQSNWLPHPGGVDVFIDRIKVVVSEPMPTPLPTPQPIDVAAIRFHLKSIEDVVTAIKSLLTSP